MWPGHWATIKPDAVAYVMASSGTAVTYRELNDRSNQLTQHFWELGLRFGDHIAVLMDNHLRYLEVTWAAQRMGLYYTAINWHFTAEEAAYIIDDCDAEVIVASDATRAVAAELVDLTPRVRARLMIGAPLDGHDDYETTVARYPAEPVPDECEGTPMLYSSGTTGRPKGIKYAIRKQAMGVMPANLAMMTGMFGFSDSSVYLSPAPLYHSAPL